MITDKFHRFPLEYQAWESIVNKLDNNGRETDAREMLLFLLYPLLLGHGQLLQ